MHYPSKILEKAVDEISQLPGIGKRSALRLALHLLKNAKTKGESLAVAIDTLVNEIKYCQICHSICDDEVCEICANPFRNHELICVVEDIRDVMAIENTGQYKGVYHVLGGKISPMEGIGPQQLKVDTLKNRAVKAQEVILALSTTMEGDTTMFYIYKILKDLPVKLSAIARGVGVGDELEYTDELTLVQSIQNRVPYENSINS
ncbi:recombination protein RecR [Flavobacteriaceae bacterium Ap0902]|nr:recombination protein RecR [Flavobacteriaceae bacterium Ap0902]